MNNLKCESVNNDRNIYSRQLLAMNTSNNNSNNNNQININTINNAINNSKTINNNSNINNCNVNNNKMITAQFRCLLESAYGFELFSNYLDQNGSIKYLEMFNILKGFKERYKDASLQEKSTAAKVVCKKLINTLDTMNPKSIRLKDKTRKTIVYNIKHFSNNKDYRLENIFDDAKYELENGLQELFFNDFKLTDEYQRYTNQNNNLNGKCIPNNVNDDYNDNHNDNSNVAITQSTSGNNFNTHDVELNSTYPVFVNKISFNQSKDESCSVITNVNSEKIMINNSHRLINKSDCEGTLPPKPDNDNRNFLKFMEKLNRIKKEKEAEENASHTLNKLGRLNGEKFSNLPPQFLLDVMKDKLTDYSENDAEADDHILDEHLCRVWSPDSSPVNRSRSEVKPNSVPPQYNNNPPYLSRDDYIADGYTSAEKHFSENNIPAQKRIMQQQHPYKWASYHNTDSSAESGPELFGNNDKLIFISNQQRRQEICRSYGDGANISHKGSANSIHNMSNMSLRINNAQDYTDGHLRRSDIESIHRLSLSRSNHYSNSISNVERSHPKVDVRKLERKNNRTNQNANKISLKPQIDKGNETFNEKLIVGYKFGDEQVPFKKILKGYNSLTLGQFKQMIQFRKGSQIFYFKKESKDFGTSYVMEEISDDNEILPMFEGNKIYAVIEQSSPEIK